MKVTAYDIEGNAFEKTVEIKESNYVPDESTSSYELGYWGKIVSFGWPCEYYIRSLLRQVPFKTPLCIDVTGGNHKGSSVYISAEDLNNILWGFLL